MENKMMNSSSYKNETIFSSTTMYPITNKKNLNDTNASLFRTNAILKKNKERVNFFDSIDEKYLIKDNKLKFDDYKNTSNHIMKDYNYNTKNESSLPLAALTNSKIFSEIESKIFKQTFHNNALHQNSSEGSLMKINISEEDYKNPIYSLLTLQKNKMIYKCMSHNLNHREINKLKEIKEIMDENSKMKQGIKVKITSTAPKYLDGYNQNNINNMNSLSVDMKSSSPKKTLDKNPNIKHTQLNGVINFDKDSNSTNMFGYYIYSRKNFPEGREQFSWCMDGNDIILYGGLTTSQNNCLWMLDPLNIEWRKIESKNTIGNLRYGHTIAIYQRKIYIFGGRTRFQNSFYFPDLEVFDLDERIWNNPVLYTSTTMKFRRNHVACVIGQHMLIHGGISENEEYLSDTHLLSFHPLKWVKVNFSSEDQSPTLAWHTCSLVLPNDQLFSNKLSIFKFPDQNLNRKINSKIKERGLYFFGGRCNSEGEVSNELWVLRIGKPSFQWLKISTAGEPPCPRYAHSMSFYEESNYLIIHGGRNDSSKDGFALNDTYLLELWTFNWIKVKICFDSPSSQIYKRCSHSSLIYTNKLLIFGGMNNINYIGSSLLVIDLDSHNKGIPQLFSHEYNNTLNKKITPIFESPGLLKSTSSIGNSNSKQQIRNVRRKISVMRYNCLLPPIK